MYHASLKHGLRQTVWCHMPQTRSKRRTAKRVTLCTIFKRSYAAHFKEDNVQLASTLSFNFFISIIYKKQQTLEILIKTQTYLV